MQVSPVGAAAELAPALPSAITQLLRQVPDGQFRARLLKTLSGAARAITRLREIDLSRIERIAATPDAGAMALWEEAAPAVGASITDVNALLTTIGEQFPTAALREDADDIDLAFGVMDSGAMGSAGPPDPAQAIATTPAEKQKAAERTIQDIADALHREVKRFGHRVRTPSVMTDPWNLLVDIQEFRGKCRAAIGELVCSSLSAFGEASRSAVVPEYAKDLVEALAVRQGWATIARTMGPLNARLQAAPADQQGALLLQVQAELNFFRGSRGHQYMRAGDKRLVLSFTLELAKAIAEKRSGRPTQLLVEGFAKFLDSLALINRREILINHDREAFAECGTLLEQASFCLSLEEPARALDKLRQSLDVAWRLQGRDHTLDECLVLRQRWPADQLTDDALASVIEELRVCLAECSTHIPAGMV